MKKHIQFLFIASILTIFSVNSLFAQSQEQIEEFNKQRVDYFTENLDLTEAESKAFWPVYEDYQNRKMLLTEDERNTYRYIRNNEDNLSDKEVDSVLEQIYQLKEGHLKLDEEYYRVKFMEVLPAKKVLSLQKVEMDFRRHLIGRLRGQGPRDGRGRGTGGGNRPDDAPPPLY